MCPTGGGMGTAPKACLPCHYPKQNSTAKSPAFVEKGMAIICAFTVLRIRWFSPKTTVGVEP